MKTWTETLNDIHTAFDPAFAAARDAYLASGDSPRTRDRAGYRAAQERVYQERDAEIERRRAVYDAA